VQFLSFFKDKGHSSFFHFFLLKTISIECKNCSIVIKIVDYFFSCYNDFLIKTLLENLFGVFCFFFAKLKILLANKQTGLDKFNNSYSTYRLTAMVFCRNCKR